MLTNDALGKIQDEITRHLEAFHLPSMHVTALAGLLLTDVVEPAIRAEQERCAHIADQRAEKYSARYAVDEETDDYLTGAESAAHAIAELIRAS